MTPKGNCCRQLDNAVMPRVTKEDRRAFINFGTDTVIAFL